MRQQPELPDSFGLLQSCTSYIGGLHHHIRHGFSCHGTFVPNTATTHNALFRQMADIRAQQDQHIAIFCQIQQHLGLLPPPQTEISGPSEPIAPAKETIKVDVPP
ncbi:hypothetical protein VitviT2T_015751 [Vitis vinifera]|uniref:Uncharacterized protein n=1 Tax=Vitis vinifera TaxID=29760 RepID=A0ABY9CQX5_VITVI|nr:hypothetical protein VitviT2T_015751 [Vitis vinifera]